MQSTNSLHNPPPKTPPTTRKKDTLNIPTLKEIQAQKNKPPETSTLANEATKKHIEPYKPMVRLTSHYPIEQLKKLKQPKSITFANGKKLTVQEMTQKFISEQENQKKQKHKNNNNNKPFAFFLEKH